VLQSHLLGMCAYQLPNGAITDQSVGTTHTRVVCNATRWQSTHNTTLVYTSAACQLHEDAAILYTPQHATSTTLICCGSPDTTCVTSCGFLASSFLNSAFTRLRNVSACISHVHTCTALTHGHCLQSMITALCYCYRLSTELIVLV
jgi:hypothetical protein